MRIAIEHRRRLPATELIEIVTPRTNVATITPMENLFAAVSLPEPFALEITATREARRFIARAQSAVMRHHLEEQLGVAYPQADLRAGYADQDPEADPACLREGEQVVCCALVLRAPDYLPLRTFGDSDVDAQRLAQADPVLGILAATGNMPEGWRTVAQLILRPAPAGWARPYLRRAIQYEAAARRQAEHEEVSLTSVFLLAGLIAVGAVGYQGYLWYDAGNWLHIALLTGSVGLGASGAFKLWQQLSDRTVVDTRLIHEKLDARVAYLMQLRLAVFAPADTPLSEMEARLSQLAASYQQFSLAAGNGLEPSPARLRGHDLRELAPLPGEKGGGTLTSRELAGLWHMPQAQADALLLERTTARKRLPLPGAVASGCRVGVSGRQGHQVSVALPDDLLSRNLLLVAKTRRGKSSQMLRIAQHLMGGRHAEEAERCILIVDPHSDLARETLGLVPPERRDSVVYLDVANGERPFGLNLLDTVLWPDRDRAVSSTLTIFNREFDRSWGSRMEDAFRFALLTLYEANQSLCRFDPSGRGSQHTVLDVPALYDDGPFRDSVLEVTSDPTIRNWWRRYERKDRRLQEEITTPVKTKIHRFAGSRAAQGMVGQPASTVDPAAWVREGNIVILNTARGVVGEGTSSLIGGTLINLVAMAAAQQAECDVSGRQRVTFLVDEFHTMMGADYEYILSELGKYGANLVLATQSLASLEATDRENNRRLRQKVFSNIDGLFAFHVSAEDARYLAPELGDGVDEEDLGELGNHQCYARLTVGGERLPAFSVQLDPPPLGDPSVRDELAAASAARYGRDRKLVDVDLRLALARVEFARQEAADEYGSGSISAAGMGTLVPGGRTDGRRKQRSKNTRTHNRPPETTDLRPTVETRQLTLADQAEHIPARAGVHDGTPTIPKNDEQWEEDELWATGRHSGMLGA